MTTIAHKLQEVRTRIGAACEAAGRPPADVQLLAVSKTFPAECVAEAARAGQRDFGENYVQEGVDKITTLRLALPELALRWHCIGPVQSNKTRSVAEHFDWVHTVDRDKIAERLSAQRPVGLAPLQVCIQVNIDGGRTKAGVAPEAALDLARVVAKLPRLTLRGLMAIPDHTPEFIAQLSIHKSARALFEQISAAREPGFEQFDTLSLGMTGDLEAAIAAGSTLVRIGSGVFGRRSYPAA